MDLGQTPRAREMRDSLRQQCSKSVVLKRARVEEEGQTVQFASEEAGASCRAQLSVDRITGRCKWTVEGKPDRARIFELELDCVQQLCEKETLKIPARKRNRTVEAQALHALPSSQVEDVQTGGQAGQTLKGVRIGVANAVYVRVNDLKRLKINYWQQYVLECKSNNPQTAGILKAFKKHFLVSEHTPALMVISTEHILQTPPPHLFRETDDDVLTDF